MTTIEGNKLIAEFMKFYDYDCEKCKHICDCNFLQCDLSDEEKNELLLYHSSWDWLMPVNKKIRTIKYESNGSGNKKASEAYKWGINLGLYISDINTSWVAIVKFIKWYNKNA